MPSRMHASRPANASSQNIELTDVGTEPIWQIVPLSGSTSAVINANSDGTVISGNGREIVEQSFTEGSHVASKHA